MRRETLICIIGIMATSFILPHVSLPSQGVRTYEDSGTIELDEDYYSHLQIDFRTGDSIDVTYWMDVSSGPYIDVFFMDHWNFQKYKAGDSFDVVPELTDINTKSTSLRATLTTHGTYYLVFDNTDVYTEPPWNMVNDVALIDYTLTAETNYPTTESSSGSIAIFAVIAFIGIIVGVLVVIIILSVWIRKKKSEHPSYPPPPWPPSPPPIPPQTPPIPPQQPPHQPPPQQYIPPPVPPQNPPPRQPMAYQPPPPQYPQQQPPQYPPQTGYR